MTGAVSSAPPSLSLPCARALSLSLSLTHTCTHMHTHMHTHTHSFFYIHVHHHSGTQDRQQKLCLLAVLTNTVCLTSWAWQSAVLATPCTVLAGGQGELRCQKGPWREEPWVGTPSLLFTRLPQHRGAGLCVRLNATCTALGTPGRVQGGEHERGQVMGHFLKWSWLPLSFRLGVAMGLPTRTLS